MISSIHSAFRGIGHRLRGDGGFTLVELLVAMVLMLVIMAAIYAIWFGLQRTYSYTDEDMTAQEQARAALNELVEFIRTARQPDPAPSDALAVVIVSADANSLVCWTDVDRDPYHDLELVRFRVDQSSRTLYRDTSETADPTFSGASSVRMVANWVSNDSGTPLFKYYKGGGIPMDDYPVLDTTQIRAIEIHLKIDVYTEGRPIAHELTSVVQPRNLRQY